MRRSVSLLSLVAVALLSVLLGCGRQPDGADQIQVQSAHLEDLRFKAGGVAVGSATTNANLVVETPGGVTHTWDIRLGGPVFGAYFGFGTQIIAIDRRNFDLSEADDDLTVDDLFATYTGSNKAGVIGIGANGYAVSSKHGAKINATFFSAGLEFGFAFDSLTLKLDP